MRLPLSTFALAAALALGACVSMLPGCSRPPAAPARPTPDGTYTVRGRVTNVPDPAKPHSEFRVHHEAIDNFRHIDGKVRGMGSMTMEFPPAAGVQIGHIKPGDIVEITFSVWWNAQPPWEATKVVVLPPDTKLEFRKANPPTPPADPAEPPGG